jgi:hypothetical protein
MCPTERSIEVRTGKRIRHEEKTSRYPYRIARWFSGRAASKRSSRSQTHILSIICPWLDLRTKPFSCFLLCCSRHTQASSQHIRGTLLVVLLKRYQATAQV